MTYNTGYTSLPATSLALPHSGVPFIDERNGKISREWWLFLQNLYERVGGPSAPSNSNISTVASRPNPEFLGDDGYIEEAMFVPGLPGPSGQAGATGAAGAAAHSLIDDNQLDVMSEALSSNYTSLLPSSRVIGITSGGSQPAGVIGEYPTPTNLSAVSLTSATSVNVSSVLLQPGDYEISGVVTFSPAATTTVSNIAAGVSSVTNNFGAVGTYALLSASLTTGTAQYFVAPVQRFSFSTATTIYLIAYATFAVSTCTASGFMHIRRAC